MAESALIESLQSFRRRVRTLTFLTGIGYVLAALLGAVLAVVLVDYLLNLQAVLRVVVMVGVAVGVGWVLAHYVVRPLAAKLPLTDIAGHLEEAFPQFDDRLRSTVNFVTGTKEVHGSGVMKQHVIDQATTLINTIDLNAALQTKPAKQASGLAMAAVVVVVMVAMLWPSFVRIGLMRLVAPFSSTAWPKWVQIEMLDPVPTRVAVGQQVPVKLRLATGDRASRDVSIHYRYYNGTAVAGASVAGLTADGGEREEFMTRNPDGTYTASLDAKLAQAAVAGQLVAWVEAGDDRVEIAPITIVQRLAIERVEAAITPPPYAKLSATVVNLADAPAVVTAGSAVELRVTFTKPLAGNSVTVQPLAAGAVAPVIDWASVKPASAAGSLFAAGVFSPTESIRFHLSATDADGLTNAALEEYEIIVRPDQSPSVQIEEPRRNEERTAIATIPLRAMAEDDFAIASASLWVERIGENKRKWELPWVKAEAAVPPAELTPDDSSPDRRRYRIGYTWDLAKLEGANLQPGDVLEYFVGVTDNYSLNGVAHPAAYSGKLRVSIISQEDLAARVNEEFRAAAAAVREVKNGQTRTAVETTNLADETKDKPELDVADRAVTERLASQQSAAAGATRQVSNRLESLIKRLEENKSPNADLAQTAKDARDMLDRAAEGPMTDAGKELKSARDRKPDEKNSPQAKDERNQDFKKAGDKQNEANEKLQAAMDRLGTGGSLSATLDQFRNLLSQQQAVSKETKELARELAGKPQLSADDQKKLDKLAADQKKLSDLVDKAVAETKKNSEQLSKSDPSTSEALKLAADKAQQQQVSPNQQQASSSIKQNQQTPAQAAQKRAELGLQQVINSLREAERRKLEELAQKLAEMEKQLALLIKRQAGHNLDNLRLQGGDVIAKSKDELLTRLAELSNRLVSEIKEGKEPATTLAQLTASQQQTERNTRDLAKTAEDTQDGAKLAGVLTRAASRMERAIVGFKADKLPDAYDPPQVEALAALVEAGQVLAEQQQKVDEEKEKQEKAAIRARYEKIKVEQEKLNGDTTKIDAARGPDGKLGRPHSVNILKLPGAQGTLADDTKAIEEDLAAAGAVVYIWANKDIVEAMNGVKDALGEQKTDADVRGEQARIVEQLDAMIKHLSIKPPEKRFEQRESAGGGGGGQGAAKLPGEAELRLLKDLQSAVNANTKKLASVNPKPNDKLEALGGRQGELRKLLAEMIEMASKGQMQLGPEPDNRDQLPEEADEAAVENQELEADLLGEKPDTEKLQKGVNRVGDRMGRSRQRLATNHDGGKVTQKIQDRILLDLDELIDEARNQSAQPKPGVGQCKPKPGEQMAQAKPGEGQKPGTPKPGASQQGGKSPAQQSEQSGGGDPTAKPTTDLKQTMQEWGQTTPRLRQAVVEGATETVIDKYKNIVDDYYRALADQRRE